MQRTLRYLPALLLGRSKPVSQIEDTPFLQIIQSEGGNIVLAEMPNRELVIGAIGKFHNLLDQQVTRLALAAVYLDRFEAGIEYSIFTGEDSRTLNKMRERDYAGITFKYSF